MGDLKENRKLVVLSLPWDIDTEGLKQYMKKYGAIDDIVVLKERETGRSRGFGYVTFSSLESAQKVLESSHIINGRLLEVKVATPKSEESKKRSRKITRIFVARIPSKVDEEQFRSYFEEFGTILDLFMPKQESVSKGHRGIGFITFEESESVDKIMSQTHELGGSTIVVDRASPKEEHAKKSEKELHNNSPYGGRSYSFGGGYYDFPGSAYGGEYSGNNPGYGRGYGGSACSAIPYASSYYDSGPDHYTNSAASCGPSNRIFIGKLPSESTSSDLRRYFSNFGRILDIFLPKDSKKSGGHRGYAFLTFSDAATAGRVCRRSHELLGHQIVVEHADPPNKDGGSEVDSALFAPPPPLLGGYNYRSSYDYDWQQQGAVYGSNSSYGSFMDRGASSGDSGRGYNSLDHRYRPY